MEIFAGHEVTRIIDQEYTVRVSSGSGGMYLYIGLAKIGSDPSAAVWQIKRLTLTGGVTLLYANGDSLFNNVWTDHLILPYN